MGYSQEFSALLITDSSSTPASLIFRDKIRACRVIGVCEMSFEHTVQTNSKEKILTLMLASLAYPSIQVRLIVKAREGSLCGRERRTKRVDKFIVFMRTTYTMKRADYNAYGFFNFPFPFFLFFIYSFITSFFFLVYHVITLCFR